MKLLFLALLQKQRHRFYEYCYIFFVQTVEATPKGHEGDKYEYTFRIAGDFGTIKTVSSFLKQLAVYGGLEYEKLSGGKVNNG